MAPNVLMHSSVNLSHVGVVDCSAVHGRAFRARNFLLQESCQATDPPVNCWNRVGWKSGCSTKLSAMFRKFRNLANELRIRASPNPRIQRKGERLRANSREHIKARTLRFHPRTTRTGQGAWRTTRSVVLPSKTCASPVRPWVAITIKSAFRVLAVFVIS